MLPFSRKKVYGDESMAESFVPSSAHTVASSPYADIEQPLIRRKLIKPTDLCPKQAKNFHLYSSEAFDQVMDLALHGHAHAMNPFEELEHPTQGGPFCRLVNLVRQRLVLTRQVMAQSALRHRIDQ